uniref:Unkown protein n=1 Tax=Riptortus pedestris TaxID=329032 RepID=R4WDN3_RIPPE|nr:unkown protein [Riptortus pedestris]
MKAMFSCHYILHVYMGFVKLFIVYFEDFKFCSILIFWRFILVIFTLVFMT